MKTSQKLLLLIILFLSSVKISLGQDFHYSQFYNAPLNVNPALTGIFNGDQRITASYRDQWRSIPVPWTTFSLEYDRKFYLGNTDSHFLSGGLNFNYDRQGISKMNLSNLNLSGSYSFVANRNNVISLGLLVGFATRGFDQTSLTWDRQWDGETFNSGLGSGETFNAERVSFLETGTGLNYRWQSSKRTKVDAGLGIYHLVEPNVSFFGDDGSKLNRRWSPYIISSFQLTQKFDLQVNGLAQFQNARSEYIVGALGKIYVDQRRGREMELHFGLGYRTSGSWFPTIALQYKNFYGSFSYDIDTSLFKEHTNRRGGPELHFRYIMTSVKPLKQFKVCPIF